MKSIVLSVRTFAAALRMLLILTVILGLGYPLAVTAIAQLPGLRQHADGSLVSAHGRVVGSSLIGQEFLDSKGDPLPQYFQPRPSAAGAGYDPTASGASNLGPESIVDTLPDPSVKGDTGKQSLLSQVCSRSLAVGTLDGVDGSRPYCTPDGVGAVLAVFWSAPGYTGQITKVVSVNQVAPARPFLADYRGVPVQLAHYGEALAPAQLIPVRGDAPSKPAVPADAVTASGSGLDPQISPAYARLQQARVARARGITLAQVQALVARYTIGRQLGFIGEPAVNVLLLNLALDARYPAGPH